MKIDKKDLIKFGNLEFLAKQAVEGFIIGLHKSPYHGFSVEFAEHRLYNQGESTRHIDWKLAARTEKLFIKRFEEETNLRCQIVIDNSSSMYYGNEKVTKIQYTILAAASIIELMKKQRDAVGLHIFSEGITTSTEAKSSLAHHQFLMATLEDMLHKYNEKEVFKTDFVKNLHELAETLNRRSLVMIFSDLLEDPKQLPELMEALQHMKFNKHEVIVFHVTDKSTEELLELENRPYTLIDMETQEKIKLNPSQIKEKYKEAIQDYFNELRLKCIGNKIDFVELDIAGDLELALIKYMNKRQFMRK